MPRSELPRGTLLGGKIRLIHRIGRGGMGDVWAARNEATQAELAVKTLHRSERTPLHDERFRREARLAATISHRNVVRVFDLVDEVDGTLGLVMELLRGGTLEDVLRERGPLSTTQALAAVLPVLSAMHHVHQKGIVHRDMKPANVFFAVEPDGHVIPKVLDFGIAKLPAAGSALTMDGSVLGTPHYMSPEQIRGREDIDGRSDMFSLAVVLYEMLTGVRIFHRDSASASLAAVLEHQVEPDPRTLRIWGPLSRALAKRPEDRHASCGEFATALRASVAASEEELAQALQGLRLESGGAPIATGTRTTSPASVALSGEEIPMRRWSTPVVAGGAALVAALFAIGLTLAVTRMTPTARPTIESPSRAAAPPAESAIPATTARPVMPTPPPQASPQPEPTTSAPPAFESKAPPLDRSASTRPVTPPRPPAPAGTDRKPKPKGPGVATTPGF